jgi:chitin disaccharide deacetylase
MTKRIVLCADDYGQAPAISQGILALLEKERLSATSCMVNRSYWLEHAGWLKPYLGKADIGLHFNLTDGEPVSAEYRAAYGNAFPRLSQLMRKALLRQLDVNIIAAECRAQIDVFTKAMSVLPDFIDGHQHVHQFPIIRDAIVQVSLERLRNKKYYIRLADPVIHMSDWLTNIKKLVIMAVGARACRQLFLREKIPHNQSFAGIYPFKNSSAYRQYFLRFLREITDQGLMMCHPGLAANNTNDPIRRARNDEYQYLASEQYLLDCQDAGVKISRFTQGVPTL